MGNKKHGTLIKLSISSPIIHRNFFTGTLCRQFAVLWLLYILLYRKCIFTLPCKCQTT